MFLKLFILYKWHLTAETRHSAWWLLLTKLVKLVQKDFVFINIDSRNRPRVPAGIKQNLPSWPNEGNIYINSTYFKRRTCGVRLQGNWPPPRSLFFNSFHGLTCSIRTAKSRVPFSGKWVLLWLSSCGHLERQDVTTFYSP